MRVIRVSWFPPDCVLYRRSSSHTEHGRVRATLETLPWQPRQRLFIFTTGSPEALRVGRAPAAAEISIVSLFLRWKREQREEQEESVSPEGGGLFLVEQRPLPLLHNAGVGLAFERQSRGSNA